MKIHAIFPSTNHDTNALQSSMFHGRELLMENHLKRTFIRDQNPVAAASNSSLDGACGIFGIWGRWRYLLPAGGVGGDVEFVVESPDFSSPEALFLSETGARPFWPPEVELLFLLRRTPSRFRLMECNSLLHACWARAVVVVFVGVREEGKDKHIVFSTLLVEELADPPGPRSKNKMLPEVKLFVYATFRGASIFEFGLPPEKYCFVDRDFAFIDLECLKSWEERDFGSQRWDHSRWFIIGGIIALSLWVCSGQTVEAAALKGNYEWFVLKEGTHNLPND